MISTLSSSDIPEIDIKNNITSLNTPSAKAGTYLRFFQTRDPRDFDSFAKQIHKKLINYFMKLGADFQKAEDLTQDTLFKLNNVVNSYNGQKNELGFIYKIAQRASLDAYRRLNAKKRRVDLTFFSSFKSNNEGRAFDIVEEQTESPIDRLSKQEEIEILQNYLNSLSSANRDTINEVFFKDKTRAEASKELGVGKSTITTRLTRAFKEIRAHLKF